MAGDGRAAPSRARRGWSNLADDILDTVYRRCCSSSSPYDHARFAGVCSSWRAVASWHPKLPALPLLLPLTGGATKRDPKARAYSLDDSRALHVPLKGYPLGRPVGFHDGGWVATVTGGGRRLLIVNVFSGARVPLSLRQRTIGCKSQPRVANRVAGDAQAPVTKVIFSKDPSSSDCVIAAMTMITELPWCEIALCKVSCPHDGWATWENTSEALDDIAFSGEKLYGIGSYMYQFDVGVDEKGAMVVTSVQRTDMKIKTPYVPWSSNPPEKYMFQLHGKPAILMKFSGWRNCCKTPFFRVFELMDNGCTWLEVTSLGEYALFLLGQAFCKVVHVPAIGGGSSTVERNHIYFFEQWPCSHHKTMCLNRLADLGSYTVYYEKIKQGVNHSEKIMSSGYHYGPEDGSNGCIWIMPPIRL